MTSCGDALFPAVRRRMSAHEWIGSPKSSLLRRDRPRCLHCRELARAARGAAPDDGARHPSQLDAYARIARRRCSASCRSSIEEVVVPETYFFREPDAIADVVRRALEAHARTERSDAARVERAMLLAARSRTRSRCRCSRRIAGSSISIDAMDVSVEAVRRTTRRQSIATARSAARSASGRSTFVHDHTRLERRGARALRRARGARESVVDASFTPPREQYDVIFCRNLLIYFDESAQARALGSSRRCSRRTACSWSARPTPSPRAAPASSRRPGPSDRFCFAVTRAFRRPTPYRTACGAVRSRVPTARVAESCDRQSRTRRSSALPLQSRGSTRCRSRRGANRGFACCAEVSRLADRGAARVCDRCRRARRCATASPRPSCCAGRHTPRGHATISIARKRATDGPLSRADERRRAAASRASAREAR